MPWEEACDLQGPRLQQTDLPVAQLGRAASQGGVWAPLLAQDPPSFSLLPDSWRPWAHSGGPGQGPGKGRDTEAQRTATLSAGRGRAARFSPGSPSSYDPSASPQLPSGSQTPERGALEPRVRADRPAGLWRNHGLVLALRPARGCPHWGAYAPAPGLGPSPRGASGAKAPPGSAEPPHSLQPGPHQEAGVGGRLGASACWFPPSFWGEGGGGLTGTRAVWNPLCPSGLLPL